MALKRAWLAVAILSMTAVAQGQFLLLEQDDNTVRELVNGSTLTLNAEGVNATVTTRVVVRFDGPTGSTATVNTPALTGALAFSVVPSRTLPQTLTPGQNIEFRVTFKPGATGPFSARLTLKLLQNNPSTPTREVDVLLNLTGRVADYTLSYQLPGGNEILIPQGGAVPFPDTQLDLTTNATVIVTNRGTGPGTFSSVALTGAGFQATGLQLLPVTIQAGANVRFGVAFTPTSRGAFSGSLQANFGLGSRTVGLAGSGVEAEFSYLSIQGDSQANLPPGGTLAMPQADVGEESTAVVRVTNSGTADGRISAISASGAPFTLRNPPLLPATLKPGQSLDVVVVFTPQNGDPKTGQLRIGDHIFVLSGEGRQAEFTYSWIREGRPSSAILPFGSVVFPATTIGLSETATFTVRNSGDAAGDVNSITVTGAPFRAQSPPPTPTQLQPGQTVAFTIFYEPRAEGPETGALRVDAASFNLAGIGLLDESDVTYTYRLDSATRTILPFGNLVFPSTAVSASVSASFEVVNSQAFADFDVNTLTVTGAAFTLGNPPPTPSMLPPGGRVSFTVTYTPRARGLETGALRINGAQFNLSGTGLDSELTYSFGVNQVSRKVEPRGTLLFAETPIGASTAAGFTVANTGDFEQTILQIALSGSTDFSSAKPALPAALAPGQSLVVPITYSPTRSGLQTGTLSIDGVTFTLSGVGGELPKLPAVSFSSGNTTIPPAAQGRIGLSLAAAYPVEIEGVLALAFESDVFANDPSVQFSTGGRSITFRIPANSTAAVFRQGQPDIAFQTGTVAGRITLSATFTSQTGGVDITPATPPETVFTVQRGRPVLRSVALNTINANGFSIFVTGYATDRAVNSMTFQLTAAPGKTLTTTQLTANVAEAFRTWFNGQQSTNFGSQFTATVNFSLAAGSIGDVQSISAVATNDLGASGSMSVDLQ